MTAMSTTGTELFDELGMGSAERELLELMKLDDESLYRSMGMTARETMSKLKPCNCHEASANMGDPEGKSALFFQNPTIDCPPAIHCSLPEDPVEAGTMVCGQIGAHLDRVLCETVRNSPLFGYKQETIKLGSQCIESIAKEFPMLDARIIKVFVALRAKRFFDVCSR